MNDIEMVIGRDETGSPNEWLVVRISEDSVALDRDYISKSQGGRRATWHDEGLCIEGDAQIRWLRDALSSLLPSDPSTGTNG